MGTSEEDEMDGGEYSVKRLRKGVARRLLREAGDRVARRDPRAPDEYDRELVWLKDQPFGSKQLTKAPRRKS